MRKLINLGLVITLVWGGIFAYQHHQKGDLQEKWPWVYVVGREIRDFLPVIAMEMQSQATPSQPKNYKLKTYRDHMAGGGLVAFFAAQKNGPNTPKSRASFCRRRR